MGRDLAATVVLAALLALTGCDAHFQIGDGCAETACRPSSGAEKWYAAEVHCTCSIGAHAEIQPDGLVICRCPRGGKDGGAR